MWRLMEKSSAMVFDRRAQAMEQKIEDKKKTIVCHLIIIIQNEFI